MVILLTSLQSYNEQAEFQSLNALYWVAPGNFAQATVSSTALGSRLLRAHHTFIAKPRKDL